MQQTLVQAQITNSRVTLVLGTKQIYTLVSILNVNELHVTLSANGATIGIAIALIDIIFVYKNTALFTVVDGWAITPTEPPTNPILGLATSSTFQLDLTFTSGYRLITKGISVANPSESDYAFIGNVLTNQDVIAVFTDVRLNEYHYNAGQEGFGTVGALPNTTPAESSYNITLTGDDTNSGVTETDALQTISKGLELLTERFGYGQEVELVLGDNDSNSAYLLPSDSFGAAGYKKITIKSASGNRANCFIGVEVNNFDQYDNVEFRDVTFVGKGFLNSGTFQFGDCRNITFVGTEVLAPVTFSFGERSNGLFNATTFNGTFPNGVILAEQQSYVQFANTVQFTSFDIGASAALFVARDNSLVQASGAIAVPSAKLGVAQRGSNIVLASGSTEGVTSTADANSSVTIG